MFKYVAGLSAPFLQRGKTRKKPVMEIAARHALATSIIVETEANTEWKKIATVTNNKVMKRKDKIMVRPLLYSHYYRNMSSLLTTHHSSLPRR